jgi:PAS domain S-box-containing protein
LTILLAASLLLVIMTGSVMGIFIARRISHPLEQLAHSAAQLSQGDLATPPVPVESRIREVSRIGLILEKARIDLQGTLNELQKEKAWSDHLLESIVEGIITLDGQDCINFFSQGAEQITGWSKDRVLGRHCNQVFHLTEFDTPFLEAIPAPGSMQKLDIEVAGRRKATLSFTRARLAPSEASDARVVLVFRDVSEEEVIHRLLGQFLANIAHEFRTPLSALAASTELLLDQASDLSIDELLELLNSLHLSVLSLQTLIDNLLESASIEAGRFRVNPRPSDLASIISEAAQTMQPLLNKHQQKLTLELPEKMPYVQADARRTVQVLVNLLSNAIKYGPTGEEILLSAQVQDHKVKIEISDRGPGIPHELEEVIFRRFTYSNLPEHSKKVGAGLGLSVVKAIIEGLGGEVGVDNRPGGGAIFWFTLRVEAEP